MFLTGYKILSDDYLMTGANNLEFLCNRHVTAKGILCKTQLITKHFLYSAYVTGRQKSYLMVIKH